jgi:GT2 family glycosyltransferase
VRNEEHSRLLGSEVRGAAAAAGGSVALAGFHDDSVNSTSLALAPLSAIIPTKGRPEELRVTVRSMLEGIVLPSELIIVDQSADRLSYDVVHEEFQKARNRQSFLPRLKYIHEPSIAGVSAARNVGMSHAQEAIWLFLDDDVVMDADFVKELMNAYSDRARVDGVSGIITNYALKPITHRIWLRIFERGPFADPRQPLYWNAKTVDLTGNIEVPFFTGALMSFRADAIRNIRFDEGAGDCHCEDTDVCLLLGKSARLVIAPRARLEHMISPKARERAHWIRLPTLSYAFLYRRHFTARTPDRLRFYWLCVGLGFMAGMSSLRRFSLEPWRTFVSALREGLSAGRKPASAANGAAHGAMGSASGRPRDESAKARGINGRTA